jgi:lipoprotein NlpI
MKLFLSILTSGALLAQAQTAAPKPTADELTRAVLDRAERTYRRGTFVETVRAASDVISQDPNNARAHLLRGKAYEELLDHEKAVADFNAVIRFDPGAGAVYQHRGFELFKLGRVREAISDFDKFLEMAPAQSPQHWQRGIALYYAGRFEDGRKQFESHRTVNPNDVENAVWHYLCVARLEGVAKARAALIPIQGDSRVPMKEIYDLFRGTGSVEEVLKAAEAGQPSTAALKNRLFYAHLYIGLLCEAEGKSKQAEEHILKAAGPYQQDHYMGDVARVHARLLHERTTVK